MEAHAPFAPRLAGLFDGWQFVLLLATALILFGATYPPCPQEALKHGLREFRKATHDLGKERAQKRADWFTKLLPMKTGRPSSFTPNDLMSRKTSVP